MEVFLLLLGVICLFVAVSILFHFSPWMHFFSCQTQEIYIPFWLRMSYKSKFLNCISFDLVNKIPEIPHSSQYGHNKLEIVTSRPHSIHRYGFQCFNVRVLRNSTSLVCCSVAYYYLIFLLFLIGMASKEEWDSNREITTTKMQSLEFLSITLHQFCCSYPFV